MAREKTVEITLINGTKGFVFPEEFNTFGVPESAESVIGSYIAGSRGPQLKVNSDDTFTGETFYVNPRLIVSYKVTYK